MTTGTFAFGANDGVESAVPTTSTLSEIQEAVPITAIANGQAVATTDEASATPFNGVVILDPNLGQTETAVVPGGTAANGSISDPNSAADGSTVSNGTITIKSSAAAVANALDGVVFAPGTVVTTPITATIFDTAGETTSITSTINATAVNDAPVISVGDAAAGQATQDTTAIRPFTTASVSDVDIGVQDSLTIVLSNAANGKLSGTGLTASSTAGTYTLAAATPATRTSELQGLNFTPTLHETAAGSKVTTTFALTARQTAGGSTVPRPPTAARASSPPRPRPTTSSTVLRTATPRSTAPSGTTKSPRSARRTRSMARAAMT